MIDKITDIINFLSKIETNNLNQSLDRLNDCYRLIETYTGSMIQLRIDQIRMNFNDAFILIIKNLTDLISMYSRIFPVKFCLPRNHEKIQKAISFDDDSNESKFFTFKRKRRMEISQTLELFTVQIDTCSQICDKFTQSYSDYAIVVNLFHGFNLIKSKITSRSKIHRTKHSRLKSIFFNQNIDFDIPIYILPRETRIEFILIGVRTTSNNKIEIDALATTFFHLYDSDEIFLNGSYILPWNEMDPCQSLSISLEAFDVGDDENKHTLIQEFFQHNYSVSHNLNPNAMMLVVNVAQHLSSNIDYCFPQIRPKDDQISSLDYVIPFNSVSGTSIEGDSLYGFHGCNPNLLNPDVIKILQKNPIENLTSIERDLIWRERQTLKEFPGSILKLIKSPPSWSYHDLPSIYGLLKKYDSGPFQKVFRTKIESLQLLGIDYPDKLVRRTAVKWLNTVPVDEVCDYLPQLVQALRFETSIDSHLIWSLFEFALMSARFCHYFYWQLKSCLNDRCFSHRCRIYLNSLLIVCGEITSLQFREQEKLCDQFSMISGEIKQVPKDSRSVILRQKLDKINEQLNLNPTSLPLSPSLFVNGLELNQCSYFNSNSLPLKLVFNAAPTYRLNPSKNPSDVVKNSQSLSDTDINLQTIYQAKPICHKIIFKCGDDLRKDMLVMQIISIINRVWLRSGLNLHLIIFGVQNTSERTGMIEMVSRASTLREIQLEYGLTGNFKHHTIATWLKRYNTNEFDYKMAIENFVHSCAGYVVITYLLGICDRHNDNIMVTTSGNLFHIDFGKFFGDAQMMAGIKRDRVPFVFTADMAFVINEGGRPSKNYQFFVDLCCRCFLLIRQNGDFILSLLTMMIRSGIDYLSSETIQYFHKALMPNLIESQAKVEFNRLIEKAVRSFSTQLNFFIHSIAQSFSSGSGSNSNSNTAKDHQDLNLIDSPSTSSFASGLIDNNKKISEFDDHLDSSMTDSCEFSFTKNRVTASQDPYITQLEIVNFRFFVPEKNEKIYFYKVKVDRRNYPENFVYRSFKEFLELSEKLSRRFPLIKLHSMKRSPILNRSNRQEIASQRVREIQMFLKNLLSMASEISHSDIVYTFFASILRDQQFSDIETGQTIVQSGSIKAGSSPLSVFLRQPKIKLNIGFRDDALHILVCHVRNLDSDRSNVPDSYVKLYLRPDHNKSSKRKTRVMPKNAHPTFMESFVYHYTLEQLMSKILEVSVWESDMTSNKRLGQVEIPLNQIDLHAKNERWFDLK
ncbi:phosphatidylinositol 4-phosphate 3-kinase C2 domain-containing subunit alpha-like protein [Sarcoptes scabiei]|nr:phosphatidylinositol 4-phosphate 3-kinase C2 domain-containing subunit alpha-like protein [Sarcoptes scabiei]